MVAKKNEILTEIMAREGLVSSKSEATRLIKAGAVEFDGEVVKDIRAKLERGGILRVGKKRFVKIKIV